MKRILRTRRRKMLVLGLAAALMAAGGAFAYFLSQGSGSTTVAIGSAPSITVSPNASGLDALLPGDTISVPVTLTNSTSKSQHVGTLTGSVDTSSAPGCDPSWFTVAPDAENVDVPAGGGTQVGHISVTFANTPATDQSACEDAHPTLTVVAG